MTTGPTGNLSPVVLWVSARYGWVMTPTAAAAIVMPELCPSLSPLVSGGRFRTVELQQLRGLEFEQQAAVIKEAVEHYNVSHIAIDGQGVGEAVWQIVKNWFPAAICYQMSLFLSTLLSSKCCRSYAPDAGNMTAASRVWSGPLTLFAKLLRQAVSSLTKLTDRAA